MGRDDIAFAIPFGQRSSSSRGESFTCIDASPTAKGSPQTITSAASAAIICPQKTVSVLLASDNDLYVYHTSAVSSAANFILPAGTIVPVEANAGTTFYVMAVSASCSLTYMFSLGQE
jgi:hypothetical protein